MGKNEKIGIVGSGFIGQSWAMLFASVGYQVYLYDSNPSQVASALRDTKKQLKFLEEIGMLKGVLSADEQFECIKAASDLQDCVKGAKYVQESVFDKVDVKKKVFVEMDKIADADTIMASSTSYLVPSKFTDGLTHKENCIVAHPVNPPYYVPMVEVVPAPWTSKTTSLRTQEILKEIGQKPVVFAFEQVGFGLNRLQCAALNVCNNLVKSGVISADEVDMLMRDGLGYRYAWMGPLETTSLNLIGGMSDAVERAGQVFVSVAKDLGPTPAWTREDSKNMLEQLDPLYPVEKLQERREWRNERLIALAKLKKEMKEAEKSEI